MTQAKLAQGCFPLFPCLDHFLAKAMGQVELALVLQPGGDPVEPSRTLIVGLVLQGMGVVDFQAEGLAPAPAFAFQHLLQIVRRQVE